MTPEPPGAPYCIVTSWDVAPVVCRDLADIAGRLIDELAGRKMRFMLDRLQFGTADDAFRDFVSVYFGTLAKPDDPESFEASAHRRVFTGRGEQIPMLQDAIRAELKRRKAEGIAA